VQYQWLFLWSDILLALLLLAVASLGILASRRPHLRNAFRTVISHKSGMITFIILCAYLSVAMLDSIHFRVVADQNAPAQTFVKPVQSVLDRVIAPVGQQDEKTYSKPFASHLFIKEAITQPDGSVKHDYPRLIYGGAHLQDPSTEQARDIALNSLSGLVFGAMIALFTVSLLMFGIARRSKQGFVETLKRITYQQTILPWRTAFITLATLIITVTTLFYLSQYYHILGTDKVGNDVFYETIKSIRTGLLIGTLTTLVMLPFALLMGTLAGYFGGRLDDIIQYLYTTLSSIPGVLLIAAAILSLQVAISHHPELFPTLTERADARLLALCIILGVTSWTSLCRLLRAETLKVRELDFVQAGRSLGSSHLRIMFKHILPNTMHIVIITVILDFSGLVLAEAVLSYIGIGVDPTMISWGNMINAARLEMAREPVVWWPLLAAFVFMFILVLAANIFSDAVRDGFDPRLAEESR